MHPSEIKWSYSGIKDYANCPKQYQEVKVLKRFTKFPTKEMRYGTEVHSALEDYVIGHYDEDKINGTMRASKTPSQSQYHAPI